MQFEQFEKLKNSSFNHVPLIREVSVDLDTPLSIYQKLANKAYSYLLESVQGGENWGRYSIIGLPCNTVISIHNRKVVVKEDGKVISEEEVPDPLQWIEDYQQQYKTYEDENLPRFTGGLVGYFGYETIRYIEPKLDFEHKTDPLDTPDIMLMVSDEIVVFDNFDSKLFIIVHVDPAQEGAFEYAQKKLDGIEAKLQKPLAMSATQTRSIDESDFISGFTEAGFKEGVVKAKQYIVDGDIMQVVLSQRLTIPFSAAPVDLYRVLRASNPSPYMYYLNLDDHYVVGSSPEILVHLENDIVTVRPIAGTRPRGTDEAHDRELESDLLSDPKELAEHLMLIDLGRNDVGRVTETGSVKLTEKMMVERYSHVMHIVSNVTGKLLEGLSAMDVLRATFPAGTVSGAPKIRAMEIIDEIEPVKRGIYSGAVGYLSWNGNMDTAIAIRTAVIKDGTLSIQVGAGIVYDSVPDNEWAETMNKGRAIFNAVALAEAGPGKIESAGEPS